MFLTVTLNPALDKTLGVERNAPQESLRATRRVDMAGGKGINVSRALQTLGAASRALAPLGGPPGEHVAQLARAEGLAVVAVPIPGQTRMALTIDDAETRQYWHYLEPGPELTDAELARIREAFRDALEVCHTVTISGSLPCAAAAGLPAWMLREARKRGLRTALDTFGPSQREALLSGPWLVKPNREELEATLRERLDSEAACWAALERVAAAGTALAVLSLGPEGALAVADGRRWRVLPPVVTEVNDLGGGDSMVAGICWAAERGCGLEECLAWGAACGAANAEVWDPAGFTRADAERLLPQVRVQQV